MRLVWIKIKEGNSHYLQYTRKMGQRCHAKIQSIEERENLVDLLHAGTILASTKETARSTTWKATARETSRSTSRSTTRRAIESLHDRAKTRA